MKLFKLNKVFHKGRTLKQLNSFSKSKGRRRKSIRKEKLKNNTNEKNVKENSQKYISLQVPEFSIIKKRKKTDIDDTHEENMSGIDNKKTQNADNKRLSSASKSKNNTKNTSHRLSQVSVVEDLKKKSAIPIKKNRSHNNLNKQLMGESKDFIEDEAEPNFKIVPIKLSKESKNNLQNP